MFSLFPNLLSFSGFSPLLFRLTLGAIFILWSYGKLKNRGDKEAMIYGSIEGVVGILFIIGLFVQFLALVSAIFFAFKISEKIRQKAFLTDGVNYYLILFIISISLLFTGAGLIAIDLPL